MSFICTGTPAMLPAAYQELTVTALKTLPGLPSTHELLFASPSGRRAKPTDCCFFLFTSTEGLSLLCLDRNNTNKITQLTESSKLRGKPSTGNHRLKRCAFIYLFIYNVTFVSGLFNTCTFLLKQARTVKVFQFKCRIYHCCDLLMKLEM